MRENSDTQLVWRTLHATSVHLSYFAMKLVSYLCSLTAGFGKYQKFSNIAWYLHSICHMATRFNCLLHRQKREGVCVFSTHGRVYEFKHRMYQKKKTNFLERTHSEAQSTTKTHCIIQGPTFVYIYKQGLTRTIKNYGDTLRHTRTRSDQQKVISTHRDQQGP